MKNDEINITSASLCGFYLCGSPRLNLLPQGFLTAEERKEKKTQRTAKENGFNNEIVFYEDLCVPLRFFSPRLSAFKSSSARIFNCSGTQRKEDAENRKEK